MNHIIKTLQKYISKNISSNIKPLGRWNIDYCNKIINSKIDLSNEDHCGPCGQYAKIKSDEINNKDLNISKQIIQYHCPRQIIPYNYNRPTQIIKK